MANSIALTITGRLPFNCNEHAEMLKWLGLFNCPSYGIRISYEAETYLVGNQWGGKTTMYYFRIEGTEAIGSRGCEVLVEAIENSGGIIDAASFRDLDNRYQLPITWKEVA